LFLLIVLRDGFVKMIVSQSHLGDAALTSGGLAARAIRARRQISRRGIVEWVFPGDASVL